MEVEIIWRLIKQDAHRADAPERPRGLHHVRAGLPHLPLLPLHVLPRLPHALGDRHRQRPGQERGRLLERARAQRPRIPDVRPEGGPDPALQLERQAALLVSDGGVLNGQERGQPGGAVGQDRAARRQRHPRLQVHEHKVLLLGRRQRTQVRVTH